MLSDAELSEVLLRAGILEMFIKAARSEATERIKHGGRIPGWALYPGRATREFADVDAALRAIAEGEGAKPADYWESTPMSPAKVERVIGKAALENYRQHIRVSTGHPLLKPYDPKKKPYSFTAQMESVFGSAPDQAK